MSATSFEFRDEGEIYDKINAYRHARIKWLREQEIMDRMLGKGPRMRNVELSGQGASQALTYSDDDRDTEILVFPNQKDRPDRKTRPDQKFLPDVTVKSQGTHSAPVVAVKSTKSAVEQAQNKMS